MVQGSIALKKTSLIFMNNNVNSPNVLLMSDDELNDHIHIYCEGLPTVLLLRVSKTNEVPIRSYAWVTSTTFKQLQNL